MIGRGDLNLGIDLGLLNLHSRIKQSDLGIGDLLRHAGVESILIDNHTANENRVAYAAADFLLHCYVIGVDRSIFIHNCFDGIDGNNCQIIPGSLRALAGHGCDGDLS